MPFAEGQYVVTGVSINGKHSSVSRTLIVKKEKNAWITETTTIDEKGMADRAHDFNSAVEDGPIDVPAGKLVGSLYSSKKITHENELRFLDEAWRNVAVPIDGIVKRKITRDKGETTIYELLSFGLDGKPKLQFGSQ